MSAPTKGKNSESPTEPFKRAVATTLRAMAGKRDLEVAYASEKPAVNQERARLPEPPRRMSKTDAAILRGHADSMALRLAMHNPQIHKKMLPQGENARSVFAAVEQARVEATGSHHRSRG